MRKRVKFWIHIVKEQIVLVHIKATVYIKKNATNVPPRH